MPVADAVPFDIRFKQEFNSDNKENVFCSVEDDCVGGIQLKSYYIQFFFLFFSPL